MKLATGCGLLLLLATGCAAAPAPRVVKLSELKGEVPLADGQPLIVEFEEGDTLPLVFQLDGPFMHSDKQAPPLTLRAARHFFLRIDEDGFHSSVDGKDFGKKPSMPGKFQIGFHVTKEGPRANISITTPVPAALADR